MANLLTKEDKRRIQREYLIRIFSTTLFLIALLGVVASALLLPSFFLSDARERAITKQKDLLGRAIALREQDTATEDLLRSKRELETLDGATDSTRILFSDAISEIVSSLPEGVRISRLSVDGTKEVSEIQIAGTATRRSTLLSFRDTLRGVSIFSDVRLPVSNLASERDISFSISVVLKDFSI